MDIDEAIKKLERAQAIFEDNINDIEIDVARSTKSDVQDRIQDKGLKGEEYSPSYKRQRQRRGKQSSKVDLTFTGAMWRQIDFAGKSGQGSEPTTIVIGATTPSSREKVEKNTKRYGDFLRLNDEEIENAKELLILEINTLLKRALV